ncbi:MAG: 50S ribosomal protein L19e [Candidatus Micrarchaeota archaeon]|nr:50S ribosomal protein L19e [Candidatus Micrarchaeota archaeon]
MNLKSQKRLAARILKCGISRVRILPEAAEKVKAAITGSDIRKLISEGVIKKIKPKEAKRLETRKKLAQKKRGRRRGHGSRRGSKKARMGEKTEWLKKVRPQRRLLRELRDSGKISKKDYRKLYRMVKGGMFRSKKHLLMYINQHGLMGAENEKSAS